MSQARQCAIVKQIMSHYETPATQLAPCDILIVDDDSEVLLAAELVLKAYFQKIVTVSDPTQIETLLSQHAFDVILLDMNFSVGATSGREGIDWLKIARAIAPDTKIILMTAYGGIDSAADAVREGAAAYLLKPWDNAHLVATLSLVSRLARAGRAAPAL